MGQNILCLYGAWPDRASDEIKAVKTVKQILNDELMPYSGLNMAQNPLILTGAEACLKMACVCLISDGAYA